MHERDCFLRLKPLWVRELGNDTVDERLKFCFLSDRIGMSHLQASSGADLCALPVVLFDLPSIVEMLSCPSAPQDTSQYTKVVEASQMLVQVDPQEDQELMQRFPLPIQAFIRLIHRIALAQPSWDAFCQAVAKSDPPLLPSLPHSQSVSVSEYFLEEHAWKQWPHGLSRPLANIQVRRGHLIPPSSTSNPSLNMTPTQTVECIEEIVSRLLAEDDASAGVRISLSKSAPPSSSTAGEAAAAAAPVLYQNGLFVHAELLNMQPSMPIVTTTLQLPISAMPHTESKQGPSGIEEVQKESEPPATVPASKFDQMIRLLAESDDDASE